MNFKTLPFFVLSFGLFSGCTNSCQGNKTPPPAAEQTVEPTDSTQSNDQSAQDHASTSDESSGDVVASTSES